jgi:anaerobic magnesium-protoporphyrin IX monomethyl ester cyclase
MAKLALIKPSDSTSYFKTEYPNIGLGYLSSFLKANGIEVIVIDAQFEGLSLEDTKKYIQEFRPEVLGFSAMTHEIVIAAEWAKEFKKLSQDVLVIIGGPHATVAAEQTLREFSVFDMAVIGEGELTLLEVARLFRTKGYNLKSIKGIAWRNGDNIIINEERALISDLDSLPFPSYEHTNRKLNIYPLYSSRGCPGRCIFCCRILGDKIRVRSPENVLKEIQFAINKYNPELIDFCDETFTIPKARAIEISDLISQEFDGKIHWTASSRANGVDEYLFRKMKQSGCVRIYFGVESGNDTILKSICKGITIADAKNAVNLAKRTGLNTGSFFIIGHPFETSETIKDTINLAAELNTTTVAFGIMVPYPGTVIHDMAVKGGGNYKLISNKWEDYNKQVGNALELNNLSRKELEHWQRMAYITFYTRNHRYKDLVRLVISQRNLAIEMLGKLLNDTVKDLLKPT